MTPRVPPPARPGARAGFTLAEVIAAAGVLSVALTGIAFLMTSAFGTYRHQDRRLETATLVHNQVESLTATPYATLQNAIDHARHPDDPPVATADPRQDYVTQGAGQAIAQFKLDPPGDPTQDWVAKLDPATYSHAAQITSATPDPNELAATLELQDWDPLFDGPSTNNRGLIRMVFRLVGRDQKAQSVKYVTR